VARDGLSQALNRGYAAATHPFEEDELTAPASEGRAKALLEDPIIDELSLILERMRDVREKRWKEVYMSERGLPYAPQEYAPWNSNSPLFSRLPAPYTFVILRDGKRTAGDSVNPTRTIRFAKFQRNTLQAMDDSAPHILFFGNDCDPFPLTSGDFACFSSNEGRGAGKVGRALHRIPSQGTVIFPVEGKVWNEKGRRCGVIFFIETWTGATDQLPGNREPTNWLLLTGPEELPNARGNQNFYAPTGARP
jgi:hypothetical protein